MTDRNPIYAVYESFVIQDNWHNYFGSILNSDRIIESIEVIESNKPYEHGVVDSYLIKTKSGKEFTASFTYWSFDTVISNSSTKEIYANHKNDKVTAELYTKLKSLYVGNNNYTLCMIMFKDSENNTKLTNSVGLESHEVFAGVQQAAFRSISPKLNNIQCICIRINKDEKKRIKLYQKMLDKQLATTFPYSYIDSSTEAEQNRDILILTRNKLL